MSNYDPRIKKVVISSLIGATIEWYDFFLYGVVAGIVFNKLYFPTGDPTISTLLAYVTFAVGFLTRPIGGIVFGHFGDKLGRKKMLVMTMMIMGCSTVGVALIPTYNQIGIWAPIILLTLRVVQGLGLGGEWGGSVLMVYEYAPPKLRGFFASFPQIGLSIGLCISSGVVGLLSLFLNNEQFMAYGWRIAFALSIILVVAGTWIRNNLVDTPEFQQIKQEQGVVKTPFLEMWRNHTGNIIAGMGARYIDGVFFNVFGVFSITYLTQSVKIDRSEALLGVTLAAIVMCFFIPAFGYLSDRLGRTKVYAIASIICGASAFPSFYFMKNGGSSLIIWLAVIIPLGIFYAAVYGPEAALFSELFDAKVRYTGVSFVYQFSGIFASGITPIVATALLKVGNGSANYLCDYVLFSAAVSALSAWWIGTHKSEHALESAQANMKKAS
ncbi:MFS transporter [Desulfitobacterium sp. Sab5]|uniref:MFS transporter n=1 Tax=Desulfitobacterium nosdiversum TaxID=3375356 RepID=UPI003CEDA9E7